MREAPWWRSASETGLSAKLAVSIGTEAGIRLIALSGSAVRAASAVPTHTQAPLRQPDPTLASPADVADPPGNAVGSFIATLSPDQRQAVLDYLRSPSLVSLSTLVRMLNAAQQHMLVDVLASHDAVTAGAPRTPQQAPSLAAAPPQPAHGTAPPTLAQVDPGVTVSAPAGIAVHVIPTVTGSLLYLSYVLQNNTNGTLHADPHEVQATGGQPIDVRQMDPGAPGMIAVGSVRWATVVASRSCQRNVAAPERCGRRCAGGNPRDESALETNE